VRLAVLAAFICQACGGASIGNTCDGASGCGEDAVCDLTDPAGPVCIDKDGDIDGDGIPNDRDFCNHMPGGEFDEDGDRLGDECDPCPIAAPLDEPDPDGDGVDAPCDPDPRTPGDSIALFEGFNGPLPATWKGSASWQVVGGAVVFTPTDNSIVEELRAPLPALTTQVAVLSAYRVDSVDTTASQNIAGISTIDRRPAGISKVNCNGRRTTGGEDALVIDSDRGINQKTFLDLFNTANLYQVSEVLDLGNGACAMIADSPSGTNNEAGAVQTQTAGEAPNEAALIARGAVVRFGYLLVIQRTPGGGT
jgi:hypothetical protein